MCVRACMCVCVTTSGKNSLIAAITDIHFLSVYESCTHALSRNILDHIDG